MLKCAGSNVVFFVPDRDATLSFPNWYVLFAKNNDKPLPVYVRSVTEYANYSLEPTKEGCDSIFNPTYVGKCELVFATCDDSVNVINRSTETLGHKESILPVSARVLKPWGKPFQYIHQEIYCAVKHFGYWDDFATNTENSFLMQTYVRPVPQSKWNLNKSFGTPIEMINRVVEKEWNERLSTEPAEGVSTVPVYTFDGQGRVTSVTANSTGRIEHLQEKIVFAVISGSDFELDGKSLITNGNINLTISYPSINTPGIVFNL